jgi:hypothetical protein
MTDLVLVIGAGDDFVHVLERSELPAHVASQSSNHAHELYDPSGARLEVAADGTVGATGVGDLPPAWLVDRVAVVLAKAQVRLNTDPNDEVGLRVPRVEGPLPVVLAALAEWMTPVVGDPPPHTAGVVHNWIHAIFG